MSPTHVSPSDPNKPWLKLCPSIHFIKLHKWIDNQISLVKFSVQFINNEIVFQPLHMHYVKSGIQRNTSLKVSLFNIKTIFWSYLNSFSKELSQSFNRPHFFFKKNYLLQCTPLFSMTDPLSFPLMLTAESSLSLTLESFPQ